MSRAPLLFVNENGKIKKSMDYVSPAPSVARVVLAWCASFFLTVVWVRDEERERKKERGGR